MTTFEYPIKCLDCGLHFTIWSWNDEWHVEHTATCPECNAQRTLGFPPLTHSQEIYEFVPGQALIRP